MIRRLLPVLLNQASAVALGLIGVKLVSKFVEPELNRSFNLFVALSPLGCLITHAGLLNLATRSWQREAAARGAYARFLWDQAAARMRLLALLLAILCGIMAWRDRDTIWLWAMLPFGLLSNFALVLQTIALGVLTVDHRPWRVLTLNLLGGAARVALPVGLALLTGMSFFSLGLGFVVHAVVVIVLVLGFFRFYWRAPRPSTEAAEKWNRELRDYGRPFLWLGLGAWILQYADRFVVDHFFDATQAGLFGYAANIGTMISLLATGGVMQLVVPTIYRDSDAARTPADWQRIAGHCDRATLAFAGLTFAGLVLFLILGPSLVGPLIDAQYAGSVAMVLPAGMAMAALQVNQFYCLLFQGRNNSAGLVKAILLISAAKTLGSVAAASLSWDAFIGWLMLSFVLSSLAGVFLIRRAGLR